MRRTVHHPPPPEASEVSGRARLPLSTAVLPGSPPGPALLCPLGGLTPGGLLGASSASGLLPEDPGLRRLLSLSCILRLGPCTQATRLLLPSVRSRAAFPLLCGVVFPAAARSRCSRSCLRPPASPSLRGSDPSAP